jgi:hypothetical protein
VHPLEPDLASRYGIDAATGLRDKS